MIFTWIERVCQFQIGAGAESRSGSGNVLSEIVEFDEFVVVKETGAFAYDWISRSGVFCGSVTCGAHGKKIIGVVEVVQFDVSSFLGFDVQVGMAVEASTSLNKCDWIQIARMAAKGSENSHGRVSKRETGGQLQFDSTRHKRNRQGALNGTEILPTTQSIEEFIDSPVSTNQNDPIDAEGIELGREKGYVSVVFGFAEKEICGCGFEHWSDNVVIGFSSSALATTTIQHHQETLFTLQGLQSIAQNDPKPVNFRLLWEIKIKNIPLALDLAILQTGQLVDGVQNHQMFLETGVDSKTLFGKFN